jgi:hypothetical protein
MTNKSDRTKLFSTRINWKMVILFSVITLYLVLMGVWFSSKDAYGNDYLAFWGAGKLASEKGYAAVYDLSSLNKIQVQELRRVSGNSQLTILTLPAALFSVFILPFQILSRLNLEVSYWVWTLLNLAALILYLIFFRRKLSADKKSAVYDLLLLLCAFPVLDNFANGQVEVFLLICVGEFIRNAVEDKPLLSGLWLGGLLLKPQILILILPILLIMRWWKPFFGFLISASVLLITSFCLSGIAGFTGLLKLWTGYAGGIATSAPEAMLNWRMIALRLNALSGTNLGWWAAGMGMLLTLAALIVLLRHRPEYGSPRWVLVMLGIFSATLALTWHAHFHMALALLPLVLFASMHHQITENLTFWWVMLTPLAWVVSSLLGVLVGPSMGNLQGVVIALTGFIMNLVLFFTVVRTAARKEEISPA